MRSLKVPPPRPTALAALLALILLAVSAVSAGILHLDPVSQDLASALQAPGSPGHPLGTDQLGRDVLARVVFGGRASLGVALAAVALSAGFGSLMGVLAGYFGGVTDSVVMGLSEALFSLPFILLAIAIIGALGPTPGIIVGVLAGTGWVTYARLLRGRVLEIRGEPYVEAARAMGLGDGRIMYRHVLPNAMNLVVVEATMQIGHMMLAEASLGFLGLGLQPPTPSWGGMLAEGQSYIWLAWWVPVLPGAVLALSVLSVNILGDWVRDCLDHRKGILR